MGTTSSNSRRRQKLNRFTPATTRLNWPLSLAYTVQAKLQRQTISQRAVPIRTARCKLSMCRLNWRLSIFSEGSLKLGTKWHMAMQNTTLKMRPKISNERLLLTNSNKPSRHCRLIKYPINTTSARWKKARGLRSLAKNSELVFGQETARAHRPQGIEPKRKAWKILVTEIICSAQKSHFYKFYFLLFET